jgi:hypothetical protein
MEGTIPDKRTPDKRTPDKRTPDTKLPAGASHEHLKTRAKHSSSPCALAMQLILTEFRLTLVTRLISALTRCNLLSPANMVLTVGARFC